MSSGPLEDVATWGWPAAAGFLAPGREEITGPAAEPFAWASVTKVVTSMAVWIAVEEGTVDWGDDAGPPGSTLAHLLSHASGWGPDSQEIKAPPATRRIYSNAGIEAAAAHVAAAAGLPFHLYAQEAVLDPLEMAGTMFRGSPASGASGPLADLLRLGRELLHPALISAETAARVRAPAFPGLAGILPGFGHQTDNSWGLGVEIRGGKHPHWTGTTNSPSTFGHFGQSGALLWVDPETSTVLAEVSAQPFGPWARERWPVLADSLLATVRSPRRGPAL